MNKFFLKLLLFVAVVTVIVSIFNISVITKQGVNYQVHEIRLPLYLKLLDFIDRHYNYKNLVINILGNTKDDEARVIKILNWVNANLQRNPPELPVVDDHPLNILIRGYGEKDQFEDIFAVLCSYAGMRALYWTFKNNSGGYYFIAFVEINGRWRPLSALTKTYADQNGHIAAVEDIVFNPKLLEPFISQVENFTTESFLNELARIDFKQISLRTHGQSPFYRIINMAEKIIKRGH